MKVSVEEKKCETEMQNLNINSDQNRHVYNEFVEEDPDDVRFLT